MLRQVEQGQWAIALVEPRLETAKQHRASPPKWVTVESQDTSVAPPVSRNSVEMV
ncbi:hypothetical protein [Thermoleptolyngbya sp. C42_A2020_037]|uniref:hypothetical protein n=1 Tax=Thermoleptolyngbya sp. C42_A2020_037 TaxID=2747799 RepID=UPI001A0A9341|nr:hypothetical protein [Thermoleptolyngbya sp. C42_A2020_037]MBF2083842.1 hypothetical protein [Thermoleptolyngbya sp. C42_A2020_037]